MDMKPNDNPERSKKTKESDENQNMLPEEKTSFVEQGSANKLAERRRRTPSQWFRKYFLEGESSLQIACECSRGDMGLQRSQEGGRRFFGHENESNKFKRG